MSDEYDALHKQAEALYMAHFTPDRGYPFGGNLERFQDIAMSLLAHPVTEVSVRALEKLVEAQALTFRANGRPTPARVRHEELMAAGK